MASKFETFKKLHSEDLFILPNAWNPESAVLIEDSGYAAVGTSSAAVAAGLGYSDGEGMPFDDYLFIIRRITSVVKIPVTIDIEMGYAKTDEAIWRNLQKLVDAGVVGINIEDSSISNGKRDLKNAEQFAKTISFLKSKLESLFINVRCDSYITNKKDETNYRIRLYESAGADGIFLPFISKPDDIKDAIANTKLPLNVMCVPGLPDVGQLGKLGVRRVSMGPFLHNKTYSVAKEIAKAVLDQRSLNPIL